MYRSFKAAAAAALVFAAVASQPAQAEDIKVLMALPSYTLTFSSAFVVEDAGFYKKHGLDVTSRNLTGVASNNAVINGSADFLLGTAATMLNGASMGQPLLMIANMVDRPMVEIVIRKDIADAAGITRESPLDQRLKLLKGKTIAVQGIGSITHSLPRLAARRAGLDPEKDITVTSMEPPTMLPALVNKQIDGYSTSLPFTTEAEVKGLGVVIVSGPRNDMPEYSPFDYVVLAGRADTCQKNQEKCARIVAAFGDANKYIQDNPDGTWAILKKHFEHMDEKILKAAWDVAKQAHPRSVAVTEKGIDDAQKWSMDAGLLDPKNEVKDYTGLWTDKYVVK